MIQSVSRKMIKEILENLYLILFALMIGHYFLFTTTFQIEWPQYFYVNLRTFLLITIVVKTAVEESIDYVSVLLGTLAAVVFLVAWKHNGYEVLSDAVLLIAGCRGIQFRKIVKTYLFVCSVILLVTMICALTGRIENFILHQNGRRPRISFGVMYPTDFSAHIFYMILGYSYLRKQKIKYLEIGAIVVAAIFVYVFCDARLNAVCFLMIAATLSYNKIRHYMAMKAHKVYNMNPVFSVLLCLSTTLSAMLMIGLTLLYSPNSKWMCFLDNALNSRLMLGKKGIDLYGFSIFGQQIRLIGNGNSTTQPLNYFFLDSSYLFVLLQYGILVLGVVLLLFMMMSFQARKEGDWILLWLLAIMSLQCMVEHHIIDISYNVLLWGVLGCLIKSTDKLKDGKWKEE